MLTKLVLVAAALAAVWAIARRRALNPQPEPPGVVGPGGGPAHFTLTIGGAESALRPTR